MASDPRALTMAAHDLARQRAGERLRNRAPILPIGRPLPRRAQRPVGCMAVAALAVAAVCALYFAAQLARPLLERIF